jgi:hypothetical protein
MSPSRAAPVTPGTRSDASEAPVAAAAVTHVPPALKSLIAALPKAELVGARGCGHWRVALQVPWTNLQQVVRATPQPCHLARPE